MPERVQELSCMGTLSTLVGCMALPHRVNHFYRHGSLRPPCEVERENNNLCLQLSFLMYSDLAAAQEQLDAHHEQRRFRQAAADAVHVWRRKTVPHLPISPEFRPPPDAAPPSDGLSVDWEAFVDGSSPTKDPSSN